jgi:O-antigen ligase
MFRLAEVTAFSIFFVFSFVKLFSSGFIDINILTYIYYFVLMFFVGRYYLINKPTRINYMFIAIAISLAWLVIVGLIRAQSEVFVYGKLRGLFISVLSIPVAVYMFRRNLLGAAVAVTTIFLLLMAVLFSIYVTYDETDPAYVLNEVYLHGSFLAGFMIFLSILIRLPIIWSVVLMACLIILGGRGPLLSLLIVSMFIVINFGFSLIKRPRLNKSGVVFSLVSFPVLVSGILYLLPNLFDRMLARWSVIFSTSDGGESTGRRIEHLFTSIAAFDSSPFIGIGLANYGLFMEGYHNESYPHNFILEILVENGLLGGLPFLVCVGLIFIKSTGNKTWSLLLYVFVCLLMSYSYASSNEFYFTLTLAIIFTGINNIKNEDIRNHSSSSFGRH